MHNPPLGTPFRAWTSPQVSTPVDPLPADPSAITANHRWRTKSARFGPTITHVPVATVITVTLSLAPFAGPEIQNTRGDYRFTAHTQTHTRTGWW